MAGISSDCSCTTAASLRPPVPRAPRDRSSSRSTATGSRRSEVFAKAFLMDGSRARTAASTLDAAADSTCIRRESWDVGSAPLPLVLASAASREASSCSARILANAGFLAMTSPGGGHTIWPAHPSRYAMKGTGHSLTVRQRTCPFVHWMPQRPAATVGGMPLQLLPLHPPPHRRSPGAAIPQHAS